MSTSLINEDIVKARQQNAPYLAEMRDAAENLIQQLHRIQHSPLFQYKPEKCGSLIAEVEKLKNELESKYQLFSNGVITVSIAGMEKSGKSTMLNRLTGITALPTADERCTSISCEIIYVDSEDTEGLEIVFYTEKQLLEVIHHQLAYLQNEKDLWKDGYSFTWSNMPGTVGDFAYYTLPTLDDIDTTQRGKYKSALEQLYNIRTILKQGSELAKLGTSYRDKLANLHLYASHKTTAVEAISEQQAIIRKITVFKKYEGGIPSLRLIDTPGVDDPNPFAFNHTMQAIKAETDLLVIACRPGNKPNLRKEDTDFLARLRRVDPVSPITKRSIFFINWHKSVDSTGKNANITKNEVLETGTFTDESIFGPCDVMNQDELQAFLSKVTERLQTAIPAQDKELLELFKDKWRKLREEVRTHVYDSLRKQMPPLSDKEEWLLGDMYDRWFAEEFDSRPQSRSSHFMDSLVAGFGHLTSTCAKHESIKELNTKIGEICKEEMLNIQEWLKEYANVQRCKQIADQKTEPCDVLMSDVAHEMSRTVDKLTQVIENISPVIQDAVYDVIARALQDQAIEEQLCPGQTAAEKLTNLCKNMSERSQDADVHFIVGNLSEFASLSMQMSCLMRYELRPALNLFDQHRWKHDRRQALVDALSHILSNSNTGRAWIPWLQAAAVPSYFNASPEDISTFMEDLCKLSFTLIYTTMMSSSNKFEALLQDFMGDASQKLSTQSHCRNGWRKGLRPFTCIILQDEYNRMKQSQATAKEFEQMLKDLKKAID